MTNLKMEEKDETRWNLMYILVIGANVLYVLFFLYVMLSTR